MITVSLAVTIPSEKLSEVLDLVRSILGPTSARSGCISIAMYQHTDELENMILLEEWETLRDLERHIQSEEYRYILALMDLSTNPPEIKFNTISKTEGMELIEGVRGKVSRL